MNKNEGDPTATLGAGDDPAHQATPVVIVRLVGLYCQAARQEEANMTIAVELLDAAS